MRTVEYYSAIKRDEILTQSIITDEPWKHYARENKPDTKGQLLYDSTYIRFLEYRWIVEQRLPGSRGRGKWGVIIKEYEVSVWNDEKVLEADDANCCITF